MNDIRIDIDIFGEKPLYVASIDNGIYKAVVSAYSLPEVLRELAISIEVKDRHDMMKKSIK